MRSPSQRVRIGISGWRYPPWRGAFYPKELQQRRELEYASRAFSSIEVNGTFYSLQRPESFERWYGETPPGFVFSIKAPRYITHIRRLVDVEGPLANFFASGLFALREKLGPILWQFPPSFRYDAERFEQFFKLLPVDTIEASRLARKREDRMSGRSKLAAGPKRKLRHAVEIRHESFINPAFLGLLRRHGIALVVADTAGKWPYSEEATADFMYLRLHGDEKLYASGYTDRALSDWAGRIRKWRPRDIYCYFDNDLKVKAPRDARKLMARLKQSWDPPPEA